MEEFKKIEDLVDHAREYVNTRIDEAKLSVAEKSSGVIALLIARAVVGIVFLLSLLFASIAASYVLGSVLGRTWLGFLVVAGFYFLTGIIVWLSRERMIRLPIMNTIIDQLFKNDYSHEKD
ncbi:MAG: phage holin family protein [Puia sp.]|nr:phage holin family protein [Puia sp.]